jgi:hypothetical protein
MKARAVRATTRTEELENEAVDRIRERRRAAYGFLDCPGREKGPYQYRHKPYRKAWGLRVALPVRAEYAGAHLAAAAALLPFLKRLDREAGARSELSIERTLPKARPDLLVRCLVFIRSIALETGT